MAKEYWLWCKKCQADVECKIEEAASYRPDITEEVLVCKKCGETICDLAEYVEAERESRANDLAEE